MIDWLRIEGFDWDDGNRQKNAEKHDVGSTEAEQVFFNDPLLVQSDDRHSREEVRFHVLGHADNGRMLHVTFTLHSRYAPMKPVSGLSRRVT